MKISQSLKRDLLEGLSLRKLRREIILKNTGEIKDTGFPEKAETEVFDNWEIFQGSGRNRSSHEGAQLLSDQVKEEIWTVAGLRQSSGRGRVYKRRRSKPSNLS